MTIRDLCEIFSDAQNKFLERSFIMLYKVWAQNCVRPKGRRIIKAYEEDLQEVFDKIFDEAEERELIDPYIYYEDGDVDKLDDKKVSEAYDKIKSWWEECKEISPGGYKIVDVESIEDIIIPNACYNHAGIIFM